MNAHTQPARDRQSDLFLSRYHLVDAGDSLHLAAWAEDTSGFHTERARQSIMKAIGGATGGGDARALALGVIEQGYLDTREMDATLDNYANAILDRILDALAPMPEGGDA